MFASSVYGFDLRNGFTGLVHGSVYGLCGLLRLSGFPDLDDQS